MNDVKLVTLEPLRVLAGAAHLNFTPTTDAAIFYGYIKNMLSGQYRLQSKARRA